VSGDPESASFSKPGGGEILFSVLNTGSCLRVAMAAAISVDDGRTIDFDTLFTTDSSWL